MLVLLECGLSNRLRTIAGFLYLENITKKKYTFHWRCDKECPGYFHNIFSLKGYDPKKICDINSKDLVLKPIYGYIGQDTIYDLVLKISGIKLTSQEVKKIEREYYVKFIPKLNIKEAIGVFLLNNSVPRNSIHIRRTDHVKLAKKKNRYTEEKKFIDFIIDTDQIVYLATDNAETQEFYLKNFDNVVVYSKISNTKDLRKTDLVHSLVDVYLCSFAINFKGTDYSSYSHLICIYHDIYRNNIDNYFYDHIYNCPLSNLMNKKNQ